MRTSILFRNVLLVVSVLLGVTLLNAKPASASVDVPKSRMPASWQTGCGVYSAAQNDRLSKPPTGTTASPNFIDQNITGTPGGTVRVEIVLLAETCVPSAAGYPKSTGHFIENVSVPGATVTSAQPNGVYYNGYNSNVNNINVVRIPVTFKLPQNVGSGFQTFTINYNVYGRINYRKDNTYQCVQYGGNPSNYNIRSNYDRCAKVSGKLTFGVNIPPPPPGTISTKKYGTANTQKVCINRDNGGNYGCSTNATQTIGSIPGAGNTFNVTTTNTGTVKLVGWRLRFTDSSGTYHSCHVGVFPGAVDVNPNGFVSYCYKADVANAKFANIFVAPNKTTNVDLWYQSTVPLDTSGSCSVTVTSPSSGKIDPGDDVTVQFTVKNLGDPPGSGLGLFWNTVFLDSKKQIYKLASPGDSMEWGFNRIKIKEARTFGLAPGDTSVFDYTFKVPDSFSVGAHTFAWRLVHEGDRRFGNTCSQTLTVNKVNKPFIQVDGSDVYSGASFAKISGPDAGKCITQTPAALAADIKTLGYHDLADRRVAKQGSSNAQYAVFASGDIGSLTDKGNTFRGNYSFARATGLTDDLSDGLFASINLPLTSNYGHFYGQNTKLPCISIEDEFGVSSVPALGGANAGKTYLTNASNDAFYVDGPQVLGGTISIPRGAKKTLIVKGNVTINGSIKYPDSYGSVSEIPYVKIVALGNIYIAPTGGPGSAGNVIDANLTAYPIDSDYANTGILDTCSTMQWQGLGALPGEWPTGGKINIGSCDRRDPSLVINGSVVARRILWKRTFGTVGLPADTQDPVCAVGIDLNTGVLPGDAVDSHKKCAAELIKFSPEAYLSGFSQGQGTLDVVPQSSQELPPIY